MFKQIFRLFVIALLTSQLWAQTPPKEGTASVTGLVTLKGEPARNVSVALQPSGQYNQKDTQRATTDDTGRFRFDRVKAGRYVLGAVVPGFVATSENQYGPQGKTINLADGENTQVEIPLRVGGVITGRVTDSRGNPIVGEGLQLSRLNEQGKPEGVFLGPNGLFYGTDDRGIYRLYGLPAGRYLIGLGFEQRPNSITMTTNRVYYPMTYYPSATDRSEAKPVEVTEGRETAGIDIVVSGLKKNYDVSGRVTYAENNQPAVGVELGYGSIMTSDKTRIGASGRNDFRTNSTGEFRMQNMLPGKYAIFAQPLKEDNSYSEPLMAEISDGDVEGLELKLHRGSSLSGVASIEGAADPATAAKVSTLRIYYNIKSQTLTASDDRSPFSLAANGGFTIKGLPPGKISFSIMTNDAAKGFSILRLERDGAMLRDGIDVGAGEQITGVRLVLGYGSGAVRGQLKIVGGALPETVSLLVGARRPDTGLTVGRTTQPDPRGMFRLDNLPPGEVEIYVSSYYRSPEPPPGYEEFTKLLAGIKQRVTVANNSEAQAELLLDFSRKEGNQ